MKKIYSLLLVGLLAIIGATTASAVTITVNFDNPDAVSVTLNGTPQTITAGDNTFTSDEYNTLCVAAVSPYAIKSVVNSYGTAQSVYSNMWYFYFYSSEDGQKFTVTTYNMDEERTASCTVNVDDASMVRAQRSGSYTAVDLVNGENIVKFNPETETQLFISAVSYDVPLYSVKLDGVEVAGSGGTFYVTLTDGCKVDVTAVIPDIDVTVTFEYSEKGEGAINSVNVNGSAVSDFDGKSLIMKAGQKLELIPNSEYNITSTLVNGVDTYWTGGYPYSTTIMDDTTIKITAAPFGKVKGTVTIDNPENLILYHGYSYQNIVIDLEAGENTIELPENNTTITWAVATGCYIKSITVNGEEKDVNNTYSLDLAEGDAIVFTTAKIVMDQKAIVWIDNRGAAETYFSFQSYKRENFNIADGYNTIEFYSEMTPFLLSWYSSASAVTVGKVYLNDELQSPLYENSDNYELHIADNDVVKIFFTTEPVSHNVTFNILNDAKVSVVSDLIKTVDTSATLSALTGTQIDITPEADQTLVVTVNGEEVAANSEGVYSMLITADTQIEINAKTSGIENVTIDSSNANAPVYNLQGIKIGSSTDNLPAGIYIVNGKKVLVK